MTLDEFIKKYEGKEDVGNTPGNIDQCVGLVMVWVEELGLPHFWGHAKDLYANAPEQHFIKIPNSPDAYPIEGDILVYGSSWGGGYGHTGIIVSSNPQEDSYKIFEQNIPLEQNPRVVTRDNWNGAIGWLRPKVYTPDPCAEVKAERDYEKGEKERYKYEARKLREEIEALRDELSVFERNMEFLIDERNKTQEKLSQALKKAKEIEDELKDEIAQRTKHIEELLKKQREMVTSHTNELNNDRERYESRLNELKLKLDECEEKGEVTLLAFSWSERFKSLFRR